MKRFFEEASAAFVTVGCCGCDAFTWNAPLSAG